MPWKKVLENLRPGGHLVQFYKTDEGALAENVGCYLSEGLKQGDGVLVIATPENAEAFRAQLAEEGSDPVYAVLNGQLAFFDARETLARFMVNGQPDWQLFREVVGVAMECVRPTSGSQGLRAYGEMVGILWNNREFAAAIRLEQFWNRLLSRSYFTLFCGYAIDIFGQDFQVDALDALLSAHTHVVPATECGVDAIHGAMREVLGPEAENLKLQIKANSRPGRTVMPFGETMALWIRKNLPGDADRILSLARQRCFPIQAASS